MGSGLLARLAVSTHLSYELIGGHSTVELEVLHISTNTNGHAHTHAWPHEKKTVFMQKKIETNILCRYVTPFSPYLTWYYRRLTSYTNVSTRFGRTNERRRGMNMECQRVWVQVSVSRIPTTACDVIIKCKPLKCVRLALMDSYWNSIRFFLLLSFLLSLRF